MLDAAPGDRPPRLDPKKKTLSASDRDEAKRAAFREEVAPLDPRAFVFVDECGAHRSLTRTHARAPRGHRAADRVPRNRGRVTTPLASLTLAGMGPALAVEGGTTTEVFAAYAEQVLAPALRPGRVVVVDDPAAHHAARARELVEARGCRLLFLPACSPDLNPIEHAFSKLKALLRQAAARTPEALEAAIGAALPVLTAAEAAGCFAHCGYSPARQ